jgi:hypothetical protein
VTQEDNYSRKPYGFLPELKITGCSNPVIQVIDEASGDVVYTIRINGGAWRPKVFSPGKYTVIVKKGTKEKKLKSLSPESSQKLIDVKF